MQSQRPNQYSLRTRSRISALAAASSDETLGTAPTTAEEGNNPRTTMPAVRPTSRIEQPAPVVQSSVSPELSFRDNPGRLNSIDTTSPGAPRKSLEMLGSPQTLLSPGGQHPYEWPTSTPPEPPREQPMHNPSTVDEGPPGLVSTPDPVTPINRAPPGLLPALPIKAPALQSSETRPDPVITAAEDGLSRQDRENLDRRYTRIRMTSDQPRVRRHSRSPSPSRRAGPSNTKTNKGKGVDPRNWGDIDLQPHEQDVEVQAQLLDSYNQFHNNQTSGDQEFEPDTMDSTAGRRSLSGPPRSTRRLGGRPISQIPLNSYIGRSLQQLTRLKSSKHRDDDPDSSSSDSSSSSDNNDYNSDRNPRFSNRKNKKHRKGKGSKHRKSKMTLKPLVPKEYNGAADSRAYYRFLTEGAAYVTDGKVAPDRQVFILSYYLTDKAYDYYTQKVALNNDQWTLTSFFEGLFNYCFPLSFRSDQRKRLRRTFQNDKTVSAYVHEIEEIFNLIGNITQRDKIIKLWDGLKPSIQQGLWKDHYNPETSSWDEVVDHAETIEMAENVTHAKLNRPSNIPEIRNRNRTAGSAEPTRRSHEQTRGRMGVKRPHHQPVNRGHGNRFRTPTAPPRQATFTRGTSNYSRGSSAQPRAFTPRTNNGSETAWSSVSRNMRGSRPPLSDKEQAELVAAGKCFICKEAGHMSRNCPKNNHVKSTNTKPPGVPNYNIEFAEESAYDSSESDSSDDEVELVNSLSLGMIDYNYFDLGDEKLHQEWKQYYTRQGKHVLIRQELGDALAIGAQRILSQEAPYPGDEPGSWKSGNKSDGSRFQVIPMPEDNYSIYDLTYERCGTLSGRRLRDPDFLVAEWYAQRSREWSGCRVSLDTKNVPMGDSYGYNAQNVITHGIDLLYPTKNTQCDDNNRFTVTPSGRARWDINDADFPNAPLHVSIQELANPKIDLANWYRVHRYGRPKTLSTIPRVPQFFIDAYLLSTLRFGNQKHSKKKPENHISESIESDTDSDMPGLMPLSSSDDEDDNITNRPSFNCFSMIADDGEEPIPANGFHPSDPNHADMSRQPTPDPIDDPALQSPTPSAPPAEQAWTDEAVENEPQSTWTEDTTDVNYPDRSRFSSDAEYNWEMGVEGRTLISRNRLGNILGPTLQQILATSRPYPGDEIFSVNENDEERFIVQLATPHVHKIIDLLRQTVTYIDTELAIYPNFKPALEYAYRCALAIGQPLPIEWILEENEQIGDYIERHLEQILQMGQPYLYDTRFELRNRIRCHVHWNPEDRDQLLIEDRMTRRVWYLPRYRILEPPFDLPAWFQERLLFQHSTFDNDLYYVGRPPPGDDYDSLDRAIDLEVVTGAETVRLNGVSQPEGFHEDQSQSPPP